MKITITKIDIGFYKIQNDDPMWVVKKLKDSLDEIQIVSVSDKNVIVSVDDTETIRKCFDCGKYEVVYSSVSDKHFLKVWGTIFDLTCFNLPFPVVEKLEKIKELTVIISSFNKVVISGNSSKFPLDKLEKMINC